MKSMARPKPEKKKEKKKKKRKEKKENPYPSVTVSQAGGRVVSSGGLGRRVRFHGSVPTPSSNRGFYFVFNRE